MPRIQCPCNTEFSLDQNEFLLGISVIFAQTYQSFDIQNAKRTSWTDIYLSFALKRELPTLFNKISVIKSLFYTVMSCQSSASQGRIAYFLFLHPKLFFCVRYVIFCVNKNPAGCANVALN